MLVQPLTPADTLVVTLDQLVAADGTGSHRYVMSDRLVGVRADPRNQSDAIHFLSFLHGRYPGILDHAAERTDDPVAQAWLADAAAAFSEERNVLTLLTARVGPKPSTAGQAQCEAAVAGQQRALDMLAQSDRKGCALGAAIALALDWRTVRAVIETIAHRVDVTIAECALPDMHQTALAAASHAGSPALERAMTFGAQQVLSQHRGLWDLLEARQAARAA